MEEVELGMHKLDRALDAAIRRLGGAPLTAKILADETIKDAAVPYDEIEERAGFVLRELFDPVSVIEEIRDKCTSPGAMSDQDKRRLRAAIGRAEKASAALLDKKDTPL